MLFETLVFRKILDSSQFFKAFEKLLDLKFNEIAIFPGLEYLPDNPLSSSIKLWCTLENIGGDFPCCLTMYFVDFQEDKIDRVAFSISLSSFLSSDCLISDDKSDYFTMILIKDGELLSVEVSDEEWGENRYRVNRILGAYKS